jgi:hypothetical protein
MSSADLAEALREALRPMVREVVTDLLTEFMSAEPVKPELLTRQQIAQAIQVTTKTVARMVKDGMPEQRVGDSPRYRLTDVLAWIEQRSREQPSGRSRGR